MKGTPLVHGELRCWPGKEALRLQAVLQGSPRLLLTFRTALFLGEGAVAVARQTQEPGEAADGAMLSDGCQDRAQPMKPSSSRWVFSECPLNKEVPVDIRRKHQQNHRESRGLWRSESQPRSGRQWGSGVCVEPGRAPWQKSAVMLKILAERDFSLGTPFERALKSKGSVRFSLWHCFGQR